MESATQNMGDVTRKTVIVVQARLRSHRLPGKVLRVAAGRPMIVHLLDRLLLSGFPVVLAVPRSDHARFAEMLETHFYQFYGGTTIRDSLRRQLSLFSQEMDDEDNVLGRFAAVCKDLSAAPSQAIAMDPSCNTAKKISSGNQGMSGKSVGDADSGAMDRIDRETQCDIVRVTADNPFVSIKYLCRLVVEHRRCGAWISYVEGLPYGAGVEVVSDAALLWADEQLRNEQLENEQLENERLRNEQLADEKLAGEQLSVNEQLGETTVQKNAEIAYAREHVTPYLYKHRLVLQGKKICCLQADKVDTAPEMRVTVDTAEDFARFERTLDRYAHERIKPSCTPPLRSVIPLRVIMADADLKK